MTTAPAYTDLTGEYTIDGGHSRIGFVARHAMVTKVRGSFNEFEGSFAVDGANPALSSARITIQAKSIDTRNADRDGHLRTNDFLAADEFPTITFASTGVTQTGESSFDVTGDLTIKGVTKSLTIPFEFGGAAKDPFGNDRVGFEGATSINRSDYGVTFNAPLETGGVLVSDKITLEFEVSAIRNA
ncbi:polyisoprenoid-binding protein YceI [Amycolatopsis sulphurea]|uniref:Polyisoprenoid-binding protein YceI n=1 Tax=Amycolatopsis sulphurea TaxID=76022 RepID=A0A2A9F9H3_9PSEU|nr:YceI family protein [Amycolatopsis sulphurea]PFG47085.1 polyisoprenoid-binding protein YceI [Amycolatopsis sulphurea]